MPRAAGLLLESLGDLERAIGGLTAEEATARYDGASSIAWTAGHVTQMVESWILHRFMGLPRDPLLADPNLGNGGDGVVADWPRMKAAITSAHESARGYLDTVTEADLARTVAYDGSITFLRRTGLNLEYALLRTAAHHFMHAGEIGAIRSRIGRPVEDYREWGRLFLGS